MKTVVVANVVENGLMHVIRKRDAHGYFLDSFAHKNHEFFKLSKRELYSSLFYRKLYVA